MSIFLWFKSKDIFGFTVFDSFFDSKNSLLLIGVDISFHLFNAFDLSIVSFILVMGANYTKCLLPISPNKVDVLPLSSRIDALTTRSIQKEPSTPSQPVTNEDKREEIVEKKENVKMAPLLGLQVSEGSSDFILISQTDSTRSSSPKDMGRSLLL